MYSLHVMANKPKKEKFLDDVEKLIIHNFKRLRKRRDGHSNNLQIRQVLTNLHRWYRKYE